MSVSRRALEEQSNQIEQVLATHKIDAFVQGATATPRIVRFDLVARISTKVSRVSALSEEIALALNSPEARIARRGGLICIEIPRNQVKTVELLSLCANLSAIPPTTAVLGLDESGQASAYPFFCTRRSPCIDCRDNRKWQDCSVVFTAHLACHL